MGDEKGVKRVEEKWKKSRREKLKGLKLRGRGERDERLEDIR